MRGRIGEPGELVRHTFHMDLVYLLISVLCLVVIPQGYPGLPGDEGRSGITGSRGPKGQPVSSYQLVHFDCPYPRVCVTYRHKMVRREPRGRMEDSALLEKKERR